MKIEKIILKKENNQTLSFEEIEFAVNNYVENKISKKDMTSFLKAIYNNGMTEEETFNLTKIMANSGEILDLNDNDNVYADKHSTGGISDITTLIVAPIVACTGIKFMKMSGRKLGFTGGTAEKLESFEGYNVSISIDEAKRLLAINGAVVITFTKDLAPADGLIYKLRDETDTVRSLPLIASSVMSKKIAGGSDVIVLDVKCGNGAFMKTKKEAKALAKIMIKIGKSFGKKISVVISDMNQPLGHCVGSLVEAIEAVKVLKGQADDKRLTNLAVFLSAKIIELGKNISFDSAHKLAFDILKSGRALEKFKNIIIAQSGSLNLFNDDYVDKILENRIIIKSKREGYISSFNLEKLGNLTRKYCDLGNSGIKVLVNLGDYVKKDSPIIELYHKNKDSKEETSLKKNVLDFSSCIHYSKNKKITNELIIDVL